MENAQNNNIISSENNRIEVGQRIGIHSIRKEFKRNEIYNPYQKGTKILAEKHRDANKPLRTLDENKSQKIELCPCCKLPVKNENLVPFNTCDNPVDYSPYGIGVSLYFSSIKFIIFIIFITSIFIGILNIYYSYKYTKELTKVCNIYFKTQNFTNQNFTEECKY